MHLMIPVFFNASHGGLHENVRATVLFMLSLSHQVTVVSRPGSFANQIGEQGANVIETNYEIGSFATALNLILDLHKKNPIDLIHAHPFASRELGVIAAQVMGVPCVVTMHGKYLDKLNENIEYLDAVFTVSEGIRHYLLTEGGVSSPEKIFVIPNTPDANLFKPKSVNLIKDNLGKIVISLVTRLDVDKTFILDIFYKVVAYASQYFSGEIHWQIVGQGTHEREFAEKVESLRGENTVSYTGWLEGEELRDAYCLSDAVIAPGRCALEAMSCGIPVIAIGSKGYIGLVDSKRWQHAVFSNFGGVGNKYAGYQEGSIEKDLEFLMQSASVRKTLGEFSESLVRQLFDSSAVNEHTLGLYQLILSSHSVSPRKPISLDEFIQLRVSGLVVKRPQPDIIDISVNCIPSSGLSYAWYVRKEGSIIQKIDYSNNHSIRISLPENGDYQIRCFIKNNQARKFSFIAANINLDSLQRLQHALNFDFKDIGFSNSVVAFDVLLALHEKIRATRPNVIVEFDSGIASVVIADALRQNGVGTLFSFNSGQRSNFYVRSVLESTALLSWVNFRPLPEVGFKTDHLAIPELDGIESVQLLSGLQGYEPADRLGFFTLITQLFDRLLPECEFWLNEKLSKEVKMFPRLNGFILCDASSVNSSEILSTLKSVCVTTDDRAEDNNFEYRYLNILSRHALEYEFMSLRSSCLKNDNLKMRNRIRFLDGLIANSKFEF